MFKRFIIIFSTLILSFCFLFSTPALAMEYYNYSAPIGDKGPLKTVASDLLVCMFLPYLKDALEKENIPKCEFDEKSSTVLSVNKLPTGEFEIKFYIGAYVESYDPPHRIYIATIVTNCVNTKITNIEKRVPTS